MKSKKGLKSILRLAMTAFIAVPMLIISGLGFVSLSSNASTSAKNEAGLLAASQVSGIEALMNEYVSFLTGASELSIVKNATNAPDASAKAFFADYAASGYGVIDIIATNAEGEIKTSFVGENGKDMFFDSDNMKTIAVRTQSPVSDMFINSEVYGGAKFFYCAKPIKNGDDTIGYAILVADASKIADYMTTTAFYGGKGQVAVFDEKGSAVTSNDGAVAAVSISSSALKSAVEANKSAITLNNGAKFNTSENAGSFVAAGNIAGSKWKFASVYPKSAATSLAVNTFLFAFIFVFAMTLINILVMIFSTRSIANPLIKMIEKMNVIKGGKTKERFEITGKNEFARMAEAFNVMLDEVSFSEGLHRTISDISDNMLFEWDFLKERMYMSDNFKSLFEISASGAKLSNGKFLDSKMDANNSDKYKRDINRLLKTKESIGAEYEVMGKDGKPMWISVRAHCVTDRLGELLRIIGVVVNIDSEKKLSQQLEEKASYDFLSGLYNRNTFEKELDAELGRSLNKKLAILFVDIDDFKFINDRFNHTIGDEAIKFVADKINSIIEKGGFAGRFGGDEFVMCINDQAMIEDIEQLSMNIIDDLYEGYFCEMANTQMNIRVSIGISLCPEHSSNGKALVAQADEAMYFVKKNGKSNYHFFDPEDSNIIDMVNRAP